MADAVPAVAVHGLRHAFGDTVAVDDLDLTVEAGEIFGLLGPNGAGKTTTIRMMTTLLPVRTGSIAVFDITPNPLRLLGAAAVLVLGAGFFCCLSITIAGMVLRRDRLMGIGQAIMMPLFFASNALYPVAVMPGGLRVLNHVNPLSYEVEALRGLLVGTLPACRWTSR
jgi:energy-coupling factor transporter ATP-binding protein EcfA2